MADTDDRLHVFESVLGEDFVIAANTDDAWAAWEESTQCSRTDPDFADDEWRQWPDDREFTLLNEDGEPKRTQTCAAWVAEHGRGFFASRNY